AVDEPHPEPFRARLPIEQAIAAQVDELVTGPDARPVPEANWRPGQRIGAGHRVALDPKDAEVAGRRYPVEHPVLAEIDEPVIAPNRLPGVLGDCRCRKRIARRPGDLRTHLNLFWKVRRRARGLCRQSWTLALCYEYSITMGTPLYLSS